MRLLIAIFLALASTAVAASSATRPTTAAACESLLARWENRFARERFATCTAPPFVVAGDMPRRELQLWCDRTIIPAQRALAASYVQTAPTEPILILLFSNEQSYRHYAKQWFNDTDVSYYGYFRRDNVMLMNIATGGGTLVHELVHALLRPDFPNCPDWVNEGMGSLYEQCNLSPLEGLPNWRLPALQEALRANKLRPLNDLLADDNFYGQEHLGMNYAQARYLLMYLQQRNQLQQFYRTLRTNHETDATGAETLKSLIAPQTLDDFERDWRKWVLTLRFR